MANQTRCWDIQESMVAVIERGGAPTQAEFHEAIANRSDRWFSACLAITRSPELAADAVQDALLSAWNKRHQFQRTARLDTWIHRIAVNAALQLVRKDRRRALEPLEHDPPDGTQTDGTYMGQHFEARLSAALDRLSELERVCFVLRHLEEWRIREIADELDVSISAVKQALFRALKKMRIHMADFRST